MGLPKRASEKEAQAFAFFENQSEAILQLTTQASERFANGFEYFFGMHRELEAGNWHDAEWRHRWSLNYFRDCLSILLAVHADMADEPLSLGETDGEARRIIEDFELELDGVKLTRPQSSRELIMLAMSYLSDFVSRLESLEVHALPDNAEVLQSTSWRALSLQKAAIYVSVIGRLGATSSGVHYA
jgi:hypothetical protein